MKLFCNGQFIGDVSELENDGTVVEGSVAAADSAEFQRLINANLFLTDVVPGMGCSCFTDPEDDTFSAEMNKLCITEHDVDAISLGRWRLDNEKITLISIEPDGRLRWRWLN